MDPTVIVGALGVASTVTAALITALVGRKQRDALAKQAAAQTEEITARITAQAHTQIYQSYGELLEQLRMDVQGARQEARGAHEAARSAEERADQAENRAYIADFKMRAMQQLLIDLRPLIAAHVPGAELWLAQLDRAIKPITATT